MNTLSNKEKNKTVVFYFPNSIFPFGSAGATRFTNIGYFFKKNNYDVFYVCRNIFKESNACETNYGTLVSANNKKHSKIKKLLFNRRIVNSNLSSLFKKFPEPDLLFVSSLAELSYYPKKILNFYRNKKTKVIISIMEYYSLKQFDNPLLQLLQTHFNNKFIEMFTSNDAYVMPISTYLSSFFTKRSLKNYVVPFVFDSDLIATSTHARSDKIVFLYSGIPFKKDDIFTALEGFAKLSKSELNRIEIHLVGVDRKYFKRHKKTHLLNFFEPFRCLFIHGKVSYKDIDKFYERADFTFLMRNPETVTSKAGFPTKICESLFKGVPVITNLTSDLNLYLVDGKNSFVVENYSADAFFKTVSRVLELPYDQFASMRSFARELAEQKLSTDALLPNFLKYIENN